MNAINKFLSRIKPAAATLAMWLVFYLYAAYFSCYKYTTGMRREMDIFLYPGELFPLEQANETILLPILLACLIAVAYVFITVYRKQSIWSLIFALIHILIIPIMALPFADFFGYTVRVTPAVIIWVIVPWSTIITFALFSVIFNILSAKNRSPDRSISRLRITERIYIPTPLSALTLLLWIIFARFYYLHIAVALGAWESMRTASGAIGLLMGIHWLSLLCLGVFTGVFIRVCQSQTVCEKIFSMIHILAIPTLYSLLSLCVVIISGGDISPELIWVMFPITIIAIFTFCCLFFTSGKYSNQPHL